MVVAVICAIVAGSIIETLYQMQPIYQSLNAGVPLQSTLIDWTFVALFSGLSALMLWFWRKLRDEVGRAKYADSARKSMYITMAMIGLIGIGFVTTSLLLPIYNLLGSY